MNEKAESERRERVLVTVDPEVKAYLDAKGELVGRGKRGGRSEALNRCVRFVMEYETCSAESMVLMAYRKADGEEGSERLAGALRGVLDREGIQI